LANRGGLFCASYTRQSLLAKNIEGEDLIFFKIKDDIFSLHSCLMKLAQRAVNLIRTGSRIYLSAGGLQTFYVSILFTGAEYPYFDSCITTVGIAAKIHISSMQFPTGNSRAFCLTVICLFETVDSTVKISRKNYFKI
jgi:hypothetical protein